MPAPAAAGAGQRRSTSPRQAGATPTLAPLQVKRSGAQLPHLLAPAQAEGRTIHRALELAAQRSSAAADGALRGSASPSAARMAASAAAAALRSSSSSRQRQL